MSETIESIWHYFDEMPAGTIVKYSDLAVTLDTEDRAFIQLTVRDLVRKRLLPEQSRFTKTIPNVGYRILESNEHRDAAREEIKRSKRKVVKALEILKNTRLGDLSHDETQAHILTTSATDATLRFMRKSEENRDAIGRNNFGMSGATPIFHRKKEIGND